MEFSIQFIRMTGMCFSRYIGLYVSRKQNEFQILCIHIILQLIKTYFYSSLEIRRKLFNNSEIVHVLQKGLKGIV